MHTYEIALPAGFSNLGSLFTSLGYTGRRNLKTITVKNASGGDLFFYRGSVAQPAATSGLLIADAEAYTVPPSDGMPIDSNSAWFESGAGGNIYIDFTPWG